jgi:hypothetical protein
VIYKFYFEIDMMNYIFVLQQKAFQCVEIVIFEAKKKFVKIHPSTNIGKMVLQNANLNSFFPLSFLFPLNTKVEAGVHQYDILS